MFWLSTVDGFLVIHENIEDMIKYVANEPSVGMYFIQQHTQSAVPNLINLKTKVLKRSHEATLHTEDLEETISITRSMKNFGLPIIDEMIQDIKASLTLVKECTIQQQSDINGSNIWAAPVTWARTMVSAQNDSEGVGSYFSYVFNYSKDKPDEAEQLRLFEQSQDGGVAENNGLMASNDYDEFKADREAKLEEWLKDSWQSSL